VSLFEESATLLRSIESEWLSGALSGLGLALNRLGDDARAADVFTQSLAESRRLNNAQSTALGLLELAMLALQQRDIPRARDLIAESVPVQRPLRNWLVAAETLEMSAWLACEERFPERAARRFAVASNLYALAGARTDWIDRDRYEAIVRRAQSQIDAEGWEREWAVGRAMSYDAALDEAVTSEPVVEDDAESPATTVLSPRELDVLRLLVEGQTNQEIAVALSISPRTVINHVANMMNKLGLESRTAVAAWAIRQGVV
jgi:DNA-binding CsgD family transcriptional regulator